MCVVFCMNVYIFTGLIRRRPSPTYIDTAIIDRHYATTFSQLRAHWLRIPWFIRSELVPPVGDEPSTSRMMMNTLSTRLSTPLFHLNYWCYLSFKAAKTKVLHVTVTSTEKCFHPESSFAIYAWVVLKVKWYIFNNLFLCVCNDKYKKKRLQPWNILKTGRKKHRRIS